MNLRILKVWGHGLREREMSWLLLHKHGEYQYRNPDSVYVHRYETFTSEADALDHIDRRIAKADRGKWVLYREVAGPMEGDEE